MELFGAILLVVIALILLGILTALKAGFNEVIRGLETLQGSSGGSGATPG